MRFAIHFLTMGVFLLTHVVLLAAESDPARPNVILIMADDLGIEGLGCYGGKSYRTPHLDRLAADGLRFTHAYSQPLCTPTRVQLMTGKYNHRNWRCFGVLDPQERTFGHLMRAAGYRTCIAGKWQLYSYDPPDYPGAEKRRGTGMLPRDAGFESYSLFHALHTEDKGSRYANPTFLRDGTLHQAVDGKYGEDLAVEFIGEFLERHRGEPTFVYYPMALPHWPMVPTPQSAAWSDTARRLEADVRYFPDMVAYMDELVGRLVQRVDDLGLREQTLILFYSDNGTDRRIVSRLGAEEVQGGKGEPTQNGIRVPLIARWPGKVNPGTCSDLIDATDFLPTLAELARHPLPPDGGAEGLSFAGSLQGNPSRRTRDSCFFWYDPRPGWDKEKRSRYVFALDHEHKLFSDGRLFAISGEGFTERPIDRTEQNSAAAAARARLQQVIDRMMQPPLCTAALTDPDEFGRP
jgi:arylsulfatase A-like enzyme